MAELVPLLTHLQPPAACSPVRLDRFSAFFAQAKHLGLSRVRPAPAYYYVFPLRRKELARLAYFCDFDYAMAGAPGLHKWDSAAKFSADWKRKLTGKAKAAARRIFC
jgi:hypothetical protein